MFIFPGWIIFHQPPNTTKKGDTLHKEIKVYLVEAMSPDVLTIHTDFGSGLVSPASPPSPCASFSKEPRHGSGTHPYEDVRYTARWACRNGIQQFLSRQGSSYMPNPNTARCFKQITQNWQQYQSIGLILPILANSSLGKIGGLKQGL